MLEERPTKSTIFRKYCPAFGLYQKEYTNKGQLWVTHLNKKCQPNSSHAINVLLWTYTQGKEQTNSNMVFYLKSDKLMNSLARINWT